MKTRPKKQERRSRRKGGYRRPDGQQGKPARQTLPCAICKEEINNLTSALAHPTDNAAVHFECALKIMKKELNPSRGEIVIYLGKGAFALIDFHAYQNRKLKIIKRIEWENQDEQNIDWRVNLRTAIQ